MTDYSEVTQKMFPTDNFASNSARLLITEYESVNPVQNIVQYYLSGLTG